MHWWLVRGGREGQHEEFALANNCLVIGWDVLPDLSAVRDLEEVKQLLKQARANLGEISAGYQAGQVLRFVKDMQPGDRVIMPLKGRPEIVVGDVTGPYVYRAQGDPGRKHSRTVKWLKKVLLRSQFSDEQLRGMNAQNTVYSIERHGIPSRVEALLKGKEIEEPEPEAIDLEADARDIIRKKIAEFFPLHDLELLVEDVLQAQRFVTSHRGRKGADRGVDVLAAHGPVGLGSPRICVQVKSGETQVGADVMRALKGAMGEHNAELGLLVAWGGFSGAVMKEAHADFFKVRLWDQDGLINAVLENYERLPERSKARLPLKRVWVYDESAASS